MSKAAMDFPKHEIKSYARLKTANGSIRQVQLSLSDCVTTYILDLIVCYSRFHGDITRSDKEHDIFDKKFIRKNTKTLCGFAIVAARLRLNRLLLLSCDALSKKFKGKTAKEICDIFISQEDLNMEKILNHMNSNPQTGEEESSIDDIVSFIDGKKEETGRSKKNKKKNKRRKAKAKEAPENVNQNHDDKDDNYEANLEAAMKEYYAGLDPAIMEKIDREVEDFERRTNLNKYERVKVVYQNKKLCDY